MVQYVVLGLGHKDSHTFPKKDLLLGKQEYTPGFLQDLEGEQAACRQPQTQSNKFHS